MTVLICLLLITIVRSASTNRSGRYDCVRKSVDDVCSRTNLWPVANCDDPRSFFVCNITSGKLALVDCQYGHVYNPSVRRCVARQRRQNGLLGNSCFFNTDCQVGMFCDSGRCICLNTHIQRENFCYEKINPGQSGCVYNEQCSAVWARTTCVNNVCQCPTLPNGRMVPVQTRDGVSCALENHCPLPIDDGALIAVSTKIALCNSDGSCEKAPGISEPGADTIKDLYECSAVVACCPNRAFTCSLPMGGPPSSGTGWWFNSATGACQQITNVNGRVNANNFATQVHCRSYCESVCPRGIGQTTNKNKKPGCVNGVGCDNNYQCSTTGNQQQCCPQPSFICSRYGGIATVPPGQITEYNSGFSESVFLRFTGTTRYYYDSHTRQCLPFIYNGAGGNFNNFVTQSDCQNFCVKRILCARGTPLTDSADREQRCSSNQVCPVSHTCTNGVCCPTQQTICSQDKQPGTCTAFSQRYWYNSANRQCEQFAYSGCQGNDNNFATLVECQSFCKTTMPEPQCRQGKALRDGRGNFASCSSRVVCPTNYECYFDGTHYGCCPTKGYTCRTGVSAGIACGPSSVRWHYDPLLRLCSSFTYLGCDGNSNNFPSREQCETYCSDPVCSNGGRPLIGNDGRTRSCSPTNVCPNTHDCITKDQGFCCPTKAFICSQFPSPGESCYTNQNQVVRYYHSTATGSCVSMNYSGCGGNNNNFESLSECQNFCGSVACLNGESVFVYPGNRQPLTCSPAVARSCPDGYTCRFDSFAKKSVCCGSSSLGVCPTGEKAYIAPFNNEPKICSPELENSCAPGYMCRFSNLRNRYYCCTSITNNRCPSNHLPYLMNDNQPQTCYVGVISKQCPDGYRCMGTENDGSQGYCCTDTAICPPTYTVLQSVTGAATCSVGTDDFCPANYQCMSAISNSTSGYCCSKSLRTTDVCGRGSSFLYNGSPVSCSPTKSGCPLNYRCQFYMPANTHYCCTMDAKELCPSGEVYLRNGLPQSCNDLPSYQCPEGYSCTMSAVEANRSYCCESQPQSEVCSSNNYLETGGLPVSCDPNDDHCPSGYGCRFSRSSNGHLCCQTDICSENYSCTEVFGGCPNGWECRFRKGRYQCCQMPPKPANTTDLRGAIERCPDGRLPVLRPRTYVTLRCLHGETCPVGSTCQLNAGICCYDSDPTAIAKVVVDTKSNECSNGGHPAVYPGTNRALHCLPIVDRCPIGFACSIANSGGYLCCSDVDLINQIYRRLLLSRQIPSSSSFGAYSPSEPPSYMRIWSDDNGCPFGDSVGDLTSKDDVRICTPDGVLPCPSTYLCVFSISYHRYQCCSFRRRSRLGIGRVVLGH